ncbi:MAG: flavodoxin family protein [candidate division Zixibacteria bacterium]|nr:flavodoxin family protein [candidate division Zixibacteria bacterium]
MSLSTLIVNGSLRPGGNTDVLLRKFAEGAAAAGSSVNWIWLRHLRISDCVGCYTCNEQNRCSIDDGMTIARTRLEAADLIVFGSPVYWCSVTGLMQTFVDRLYFYHHCDNSALLQGKTGLVLATIGESNNADYEAELLFEFFRRALKSLGISLLDELAFSGIMESGAVNDHPDHLERAFSAGRKAVAEGPR